MRLYFVRGLWIAQYTKGGSIATARRIPRPGKRTITDRKKLTLRDWEAPYTVGAYRRKR